MYCQQLFATYLDSIHSQAAWGSRCAHSLTRTAATRLSFESERRESVWSQNDSTQFLSVESLSQVSLHYEDAASPQSVDGGMDGRIPHGKTAHSPRFHIVVQRHDPTNDRTKRTRRATAHRASSSPQSQNVRVGCSPPSSRASAPREARAHSLAVPPAGVARLHHVSPSGRGASRSHRKACRSRRQGGSSDGSDG